MTHSPIYVFSILIVLCSISSICIHCKDEGVAGPPKKNLPKDPLLMSDLDLERLYDQWEENDDEKLPADELPPHKRPQPQIELPKSGDPNDLFKDPEKLLQASKKGKTVMAFANIIGKPTKDETEVITQRWQVGLLNSHIKAERYVIADDRVIFVFQDGQQAFEAKKFILDQPECKEYSIDSTTWHGRGSLDGKHDEL